MAEESDGQVYAIVELMGHRKFGASISEVERFGQKMMRAEVLGAEGIAAEQLVHPQSLYAVTICDEATARRCNANPWGLARAVPMLEPPTDASSDDEPVMACHTTGGDDADDPDLDPADIPF